MAASISMRKQPWHGGSEIEGAGADILDIGAESTRPGAKRVPASEELRRIIPVLNALRGQLKIPISVDTSKAEIGARGRGCRR